MGPAPDSESAWQPGPALGAPVGSGPAGGGPGPKVAGRLSGPRWKSGWQPGGAVAADASHCKGSHKHRDMHDRAHTHAFMFMPWYAHQAPAATHAPPPICHGRHPYAALFVLGSQVEWGGARRKGGWRARRRRRREGVLRAGSRRFAPG